MFNQETLETLIDKITDISTLVKNCGFENLRLCKPKNFNEVLHFLVTVVNEEVSIFEVIRLKIALAKCLDLQTDDIIILTDNELANPDDYIEKVLVISEVNRDEIIASLYIPISSPVNSFN